ncbi:MAG: 30S ribosome-binding factor RbfA [Bacteroidales bacterium]
METTRQNKISRLIQKDLSEIFQHLSREHFKNAMITVTGVRISPDLSIAKVALSIFATKDKNEILPLIKSKKNEIRFDLAHKVGKQLRVVPSLEFFLDDSLDYIENIEKLLK